MQRTILSNLQPALKPKKKPAAKADEKAVGTFYKGINVLKEGFKEHPKLFPIYVNNSFALKPKEGEEGRARRT